MQRRDDTADRTKRFMKGTRKTSSQYHVTHVAREDITLILRSTEKPVVQAPRYDPERDEPAFQRAWQKVSELRAQGKVAPVPPDGIRLRGSHTKPGK